MEENNNNAIIKGLAIILIAILGLNVFRTETTKKELAALTETASQIQSQIDSIESLVGQPSSPVEAGNSKLKGHENRIASLESKVSALQKTVGRLSKSPSPSTPSSGASSGTSASASGRSRQNVRVAVSAKVRVENRYVQGTTYVPKVTTGPTGTVIVNIKMTRVGAVTSASINRGSTITDEDIIDQCKEAALKTSFAYNPDAPEKSTGTITYTFTAK